jgi:hypothetical protein
MNEQQPTGVEADESPSIAALAAALAKAQGQLKAASKSSINPHFKSKYADLAAIWDVAREPLSSNGLAVLQRVSSSLDGVLITTQLVHSSGEWIKDRCVWPVAQRTPQGMGSAITYGKRYALAALVGIAADEDDDGNAASGNAGPVGGGKNRAADVKAQVAARAAAAKQETPWDRIAAALAKAGKSDENAAQFVKGVTGKPNRAALTDEDVTKVLDALEVLKSEGAAAH